MPRGPTRPSGSDIAFLTGPPAQLTVNHPSIDVDRSYFVAHHAFSPDQTGTRMAQLVYELSFKGTASDTLAGAFENCVVTCRNGITVVRSEVPDQAALHGLLARVHALGLEILDLRLIAEPGVDDSWAIDG
jgi:hypothetical protein